MLAIQYKEERAKTLLARIKKMDAIKDACVSNPSWCDPGPTDPVWLRAYDTKQKLCVQLGRLAAISLSEVY